MAVKTRARPRTFQLASPHMHGRDIAGFKRDLNRIYKAWRVDKQLHGQGYDQACRAAAREVCFGLGIPQSALEHGVTPHVRSLIRHAGTRRDLRNRAQRRRSHERRQWRARLRHRYAHHRNGPDLFVAYLEKMARLRVHEQPAGSNLGPYITEWERLTGYHAPPGVYWCGCLQNGALVAAGFPPDSTLGYCPAVEARARAGRDGWKWHGPKTTPKRGWLPLFGESEAEHIEGVVADGWPLRTVGGNTSAGDGSPNNGGEVAAHDFATYHGLPLRGFAEPPWHSL